MRLYNSYSSKIGYHRESGTSKFTDLAGHVMYIARRSLPRKLQGLCSNFSPQYFLVSSPQFEVEMYE